MTHNEHLDGDSDGLGACRGMASAFVMGMAIILVIFVVMYLMEAYK